MNNTIGIPEDDYVLITMFLDEGCPSCRDFVLEVLSTNQKLLSQKPLYLLLSASTQTAFDTIYNQYDLSHFSRLKADKKGFLKSILRESAVSPRLTIVNDNKIVLDTIYLPDQLNTEFINKLTKELGLVMSINENLEN